MSRWCLKCEAVYDLDDVRYCPADGEPLAEKSSDPDRRYVGIRVMRTFRLVELIARGGMGLIYRAEHERLGREAACKVLMRRITDPSARARFELEAHFAALASHPAIVHAWDYGFMPDGAPYILMEFLRGEDLSKLLERERLSVERAVEITRATAMAVHGLHAVDVLHRDIKPGNVFMQAVPGSDPIVRLIDLGIALRLTADHRLTGEGKVVGTPAYLSPEQARAKPLTVASDVFSLGVLAYEALTGVHPFETEGMTIEALLRAICALDPTPPTELDDAIPADVEAVVLRALGKDASKRWPTARAFADALGPALDAHPVPVAPSPRSWLAPRRLLSLAVARFDGHNPAGALTFERHMSRHGGLVSRAGDTLLVARFGVVQTYGEEARRAIRAALATFGAPEPTAGDVAIAVVTSRAEGLDTSLSPLLTAVTGLLEAVPRPGVYIDANTMNRVPGRFDLERVGSTDGLLRVHRERPTFEDDGLRRIFGRPVPLIGRTVEMTRCLAALERALTDAQPWIVTLRGPAGCGKSHLRLEFELEARRRHPDLQVFHVAGAPASGTTSLVAAIVRSLAHADPGADLQEALEAMRASRGLSPGAVETIEAAMASPPVDPSSPTEPAVGIAQTQRLLRALTEVVRRAAPALVVLEDLQPADTVALDFLEAIHDALDCGPVVVVGAARGDTFDRRPQLLAGRERHEAIELRAGGLAETTALLDHVLSRYPESLASWVHARTEGRPLFIDAVLWTLAETERLVPTADGWELTAELPADAEPAVAASVVQARLDSLPELERDVLLRASVLGPIFWRDGLLALGAPQPDEALEGLARRGLICRRVTSTIPGTVELAFTSGLVQRLVASAVPEGVKRDLQARAAAWRSSRSATKR